MTGNYQAEFFSQSPVGDNFSFPRRRAPIRRFPVISRDDNSRSVLTGPASQLAYLKEIKPFTHINPRKKLPGWCDSEHAFDLTNLFGSRSR